MSNTKYAAHSSVPLLPLVRAPLAREDTELQLMLPQFDAVDAAEELVKPTRDETIELVPRLPPRPPPSPAPEALIPRIRINDMPAEHQRSSDLEAGEGVRVIPERQPSQLKGIVGQVVPLIGQLLGGLPPLPPSESQHPHRHVSIPGHGNTRDLRTKRTERRVSERNEKLEEEPEEKDAIEEEIIVPQEAPRLATSRLERLTRLVSVPHLPLRGHTSKQ